MNQPHTDPKLPPARPSDAIYARLVDSVHDYAIFMLSPEGRIASWNSGAQRIKGYTAADAIGCHFSMFYEEAAIASGWPQEELRRALRDGRFEDEGWRLRKDGSRFWANVVISPLRDDAGTLLGYSKVTRDLTERRRHEKGLEDSERNLRLLIDSVQDYAIFMLDPNGTIVSWNPGAERIKGYRAEEAIGQPFSIFYTADAIASGWPTEELARARADGRFEDEGWRVRKDGTLIWANVVITAVRDPQGVLLGFSKVTRDLTERRRHEQALQQSEERLRLIVEGVHDHAMFLLDAAGTMLSWNPAAQRVLGYAPDEVLGRDAAMLYPAAERQSGKPEAELSGAAHAGAFQSEGWRQKADGSALWASVAITALRSSDGALEGYVQILRDLTEQRRIEELKSEGKRVLEFIAMLSHELRNPLAPIQNAVGILKSPAGRQQTERWVDLIGRQVAQLTRLVDDLLDVSRITSGKIELQRALIDINLLAQAAFESLASTVEAHGHTAELRLASEPVFAHGDPVRLTQVLVNLLTNAAKYTPPNGRIELAVRRHRSVVRLEVSDNGMGMSESLLQRAFDPFVQGAQSLDRSGGGLGIGLTLVKRIVELHGGSVVAASAGAGKGSRFTVTLPIAEPAGQPIEMSEAEAGAGAGTATSTATAATATEASASTPTEAATASATELATEASTESATRAPAATRPATQAETGAPASAAARPSRRILVVDDNCDAAESLALLLRIEGHEVLLAHSAQEALAIAAREPLSAVMLDIGLPDLSGHEVARRMRQLPSMQRTLLIATTGYGRQSDRQATAEAGFDAHLVKPVDYGDVLRLIDNARPA